MSASSPTRSLPEDQPIQIADLARHARVSTKVMRHRLFNLHKQHGDVVVRIGTEPNARWWIPSLAHLRRHWPDFGKRFYSEEEVAALRGELRDTKREVRATQARVRASERAIERLVEAVARLTGAANANDAVDGADLGVALRRASRVCGR